ncbi:MAG TPA: TetR/AcrR family transcriptional regulator [Thermoleophilia bacterium]|nr:TetR/AcrR family transcriptional regulator [Thermoleophilia bacterium]
MSPSRAETRYPLQAPFDDPVSSLPSTAQKILAAARKLLVEQGYGAVTLEKVAAEAGVNKASIRYNFGNKAGLMTAVVDALIHDECLLLAADLREIGESDGDRLHAAMQGIRRMMVSADDFKGFFDVLPHAFRDDELRERMFALYRWWYRQNLEWLGLNGPADPERSDLLMGLAELIAAIPDGLTLQMGLDPEHFDYMRPLRALELLLRNSMDDLRAAAAVDSGTQGVRGAGEGA